MCFKFWRFKWLPSERCSQSSPTTAENKDEDDMLELKKEISAINKVIEAARLRKGGETENQADLPKVRFYLDPDPERYDLDWYLTTPSLPIVHNNDNEDDEEESDADDDDDCERRCVLS
ncbi:unnamed protein product [Hymenolepis diminuta]|uniref:Uncharacterized protein n=1 Tax=Hymenolepis diminuta TaxID=6216 RepID=A0A0R3SRK6_HYMDI|nr:unnamed protein product [Hymenolepis diminuta]VUZ50359.1 unnamed protein product [Hymenolepis diminuta]